MQKVVYVSTHASIGIGVGMWTNKMEPNPLKYIIQRREYSHKCFTLWNTYNFL